MCVLLVAMSLMTLTVAAVLCLAWLTEKWLVALLIVAAADAVLAYIVYRLTLRRTMQQLHHRLDTVYEVSESIALLLQRLRRLTKKVMDIVG